MKIRSIRDVAAAVRGRREELHLNQSELARRAGVSRKWIYEFEAGKPTVELGLLLRVLDELGLAVDLTSVDALEESRQSETVDLDAVLEEHRAQ